MKSAPSKIVACFVLTLTLSACAMSSKNVAATPATSALSFAQMDITINGEDTTGFRKQCILDMESENTSEKLAVRTFDDDRLMVIRSAPGKVLITGINCMENKVFYNRFRRHKLNTPLEFNATASNINYIGKLHINYIPSSFEVGDLLLTGVGGSTDEDFRFTINVEDDFEGGKQNFLTYYENIPSGFEFKKSLLVTEAAAKEADTLHTTTDMTTPSATVSEPQTNLGVEDSNQTPEVFPVTP